MSDLSVVLSALISPVNDVRKEAENNYFLLLQQDYFNVLKNLVSFLTNTDQDHGIRMLAAVLIRQQVPFLPCDQKEIITEIRSNLLLLLQNDTNRRILKLTCHILVQLVKQEESSEWVSTIQMLINLSSSKQQRISGCFIVRILAENKNKIAVDNMMTFMVQLSYSFHDSDPDIRLETLRATVALLILCPAEHRHEFIVINDQLLIALSYALTSNNEENIVEILNSIIDIASVDPLFFKGSLDQAIETMLSISQSETLQSNLRTRALEVLLTLCEQAPSMMCQYLTHIYNMIYVLVRICTEVDDNLQEWEHEKYNEDNDYSELEDDCIYAEDGIERLCQSIGGKIIFPVVFKILLNLLQQQDWKSRRAGLTILCRLAQGSFIELGQSLEVAMVPIMNALHDPISRVKFQAIECIAVFSTVFPFNFQENFSSAILPVLIQIISLSENCFKVRGHTISALTDFVHPEKCEPQFVLPFTDSILKLLYEVLQTMPPEIQSIALTAIACIAQLIQDSFAQYYSTFVSSIKNILKNAISPDLLQLQGKAMECFGILGCVVGKQQFFDDALEVTQMLLQKMNSENSQILFEYVAPTCTRIATVLKEDFTSFLPLFVPLIIYGVQTEVDFSVEEVFDVDDEMVGKITKNEELGVEAAIVNLRGQSTRVQLNTHAIFEKIQAIRMLFDLAKSLGLFFYDYARISIEALQPLVNFWINKEVRQLASLGLSQQFHVLILALQQNRCSAQQVETILRDLIFFLLAAFEKESHIEPKNCMMESIRDILQSSAESGGSDKFGRILPPLVQLSLLECNSIVERLLSGAQKSIEMRKSLEMQIMNDQNRIIYNNDEEEDTLLFGHEEEFMQNVVDAIGNIIKGHQEAFFPTFDSLIAPFYAHLIGPDSPITFQINSISTFIDAIEYCGNQAVKFVPFCLPIFINHIQSENSTLRQSCIYGLHQIVKLFPGYFIPVAQQIVEKLVEVASESDADYEDAIENAISAIGTIWFKFHQTLDLGINTLELFHIWVSMLPLKSDRQEAKITHNQFCDLVEMEHPFIFNQDEYQLSIVFRIFAQIFLTNENKPDFIDEITLQRIPIILQQLQLKYPPQVLDKNLQVIDEEEKFTLGQFF